MRYLAVAWIVVLLGLHQDFWFWTDKTLVFGVLPVGLAYHVAYTVLAALTMFALTRLMWPKHLEAEEDRPAAGERNGHP